jgi:hypothetical protein
MAWPPEIKEKVTRVTQAFLEAFATKINEVAATALGAEETALKDQLSLPNTRTSSPYRLLAGDLGKTVEWNGTAEGICEVPEGVFAVGAVVAFTQVGEGTLKVVAVGSVKLRLPAALEAKTREQWSSLSIRQRATNEWVLAGDLAE